MSAVDACDGSLLRRLPAQHPLRPPLRDRWPWIEDADLILDMVRPLSAEEAGEIRALHGVTIPPDPSDQHYACRHWDADTRKCTNYEERPAVCRNYPYRDGTCNHCGGQALDLVAIAEETT